MYLDDETEKVAAEIQADFAEKDDRVGPVYRYLHRALPEDWAELDLYARRAWLESDAVGTVPRDKVCRMEVWCEVFDGTPGKMSRYDSKAIHNMLLMCGWKYRNSNLRFAQYGQQRGYTPD